MAFTKVFGVVAYSGTLSQNIRMKKMASVSGGVDSVVMVSLVVIAVMSTMALLSQSQQKKYNFDVHNSVKIIKDNLYLHMNDSAGWQYTVEKNSSMSCLVDHSDCSTFDGVKTAIQQIQNVADEPHLTGLDSTTRGIGLDGNGCDFFDATNGNSRCPIKINITWEPTCTASPCIDPSYRVEVKFVYSAPHGKGVNVSLSKYDFVLTK